jgi:hypothetical protein
VCQRDGGACLELTAECEIEGDVEPVQARSQCIGLARLLERVVDLDVGHCPNCGRGELQIIAAVLERPVIE